MTSNGAGTGLSNDILGNRTALGSSVSYGWDCLNRMTSYNGGTAYSYAYRADGMRVSKTQGSNVDRYRYDGQMPMETFVTKADSSTVLTENGLGARGLDYVSLTTTPSGGSPTTSVVFPIYDAHGNEVASLSRSGSSYSLSNQRSYGAWGEIRQGATTGGPRGRYCGNLGHVQDDETSLIYMRARYYEPASGRFISQDLDGHGFNWFVYCNNDPSNYCDRSGCEPNVPMDIAQILLGIAGLVGAYMYSNIAKPLVLAGLVFLAAWVGTEVLGGFNGTNVNTLNNGFAISSLMFLAIAAALYETPPDPVPSSIGAEAFAAIGAYGALLAIFMAVTDLES